MSLDQASKTALTGLLRAYCQGASEQAEAQRNRPKDVPSADDPKGLQAHLDYIRRLSVSSKVFRDDAAQKAFDRRLGERRKAFWEKLRARLTAAEIPAGERALKNLKDIWSSDELKNLPMDCTEDPLLIFSEAALGLRMKRQAPPRPR